MSQQVSIRRVLFLSLTWLSIAPAFTIARGQEITPATYQSLQFRHIGPPGNRINAVAGVAGDPSVIYAGAASGGIFKSDDGGLHWRPIFDSQHVASIGALAVARTDAGIVWAGTGDPFIRPNIEIGDGVYKSADSGKTWAHMGLDKTGRIGRVVIDPRNASVVYVAAMGHSYGPQQERGVFRTRDGGKTWERVLFVDENTGVIDIAMDPTNPSILFAATWQLTIHPWTSESGGPGSGIYVSRDGGSTWSHLTGHGLPVSPLGRIALAIAPSNPKRVYALIETAAPGNLWRSDDGGVNWSIASHDPNINRRARYFSRIGVSPDNPNEVYFLAQGLYRSLDGGASTKIIPELFPDHHDIWFDQLNPNRIIIANDRYVNITTTRGRGWLHANLPNAQVNRVAVDRRIPYNVYGSRQDGPAYRGPSNSLAQSTGVGDADEGIGLIAPDFWEWTIGAESGWAIPDRGNDDIIWVSSGSNVQHVDMRTGKMQGTGPWSVFGADSSERGSVANRKFRRNWAIPLALSPHDSRVVYAGSQYVHATADGGRSWSIISPDLTTNDKTKQQIPAGVGPETQDVPCSLFAIAESPIERGVIWTGSNDGLVHVTRDDGKTWADVTANLPGLQSWGTVTSIEPSRHALGAAYITVDRHRAADNNTYVFKTEDYGRTWRAIGGGIPKSVFAYARAVREDPHRKGMIYLGTENGLYVTVDDGATWLPLQNNLPHTPIAGLVVQEDFNDLVVGTWGRGFWILDDIGPLQQLTPTILKERAYLFDLRPAYAFALRAPTTTESFAAEFDPPSTTGHNPPYGASINYYLRSPAAGAVQLTIVDDKGKTIRVLDGPKSAGINRIWWNLRGEAPKEATGSQAQAGEGRRARAALATPGTYTVTLSVDGVVQTGKLTVRKDPDA